MSPSEHNFGGVLYHTRRCCAEARQPSDALPTATPISSLESQGAAPKDQVIKQ
jgi:hypothetical protein